MKTLSALLAVALISGVLPARAQEAAAPSPTQIPGSAQDSGMAPLETPSLFPAAPANGQPTPPSAAPEPQPAAPEATPAPAAGGKGTAEQLRQAIRIRELKTLVLQDPQVLAEKCKADQTKTEEARRILMRNYYTLLYTKMEKIDPSLTETLEPQLATILRRYEQHNVCPSILIEDVTPLPGSCSTDHGAESGTPEGTPKPSKKKVWHGQKN